MADCEAIRRCLRKILCQKLTGDETKQAQRDGTMDFGEVSRTDQLEHTAPPVPTWAVCERSKLGLGAEGFTKEGERGYGRGQKLSHFPSQTQLMELLRWFQVFSLVDLSIGEYLVEASAEELQRMPEVSCVHCVAVFCRLMPQIIKAHNYRLCTCELWH